MQTLKYTSIGEVLGVERRPLITTEPTALLETVSKLLRENNIMSVPVFDPTINKFTGIIDAFDLLRMGTAFNMFEQHGFSEELIGDSFKQFDFGTTIVQDLLNKSPKCKRIYVFDAEENIYSAMKALSTEHRGLVRMKKGAVDPYNPTTAYQMFSQSDIVRYIFKNIDKLGDIVDTRVSELGLANPLGDPNLVTVSANERTISAFHRMFSKNVKALAVVDENGKLIANLSASDLRGLTSSNLQAVKLPVYKFLEAMLGEKPPVPVSCYSSTPLRDVIMSIVTAKVHRAWVINAEQKPIGVITLTDIINVFLESEGSK